MAEPINHINQEDYIWAMKMSVNKAAIHDYMLNRDRTGTVTSISTARTKNERKENSDENKIKLLASLVPDEVIYNCDNYDNRTFDACFLFGDVSGFTDVCEKYSKTGISGPSRMTQVLNKYLGAMVQEVLSFNGDVLKFSGDAFLAMFKPEEGGNMNDAVHEAMDCALVIQKNYGSYSTDVGVVIRVKLAISTGRTVFSLIGTQSNSHYCVVGKPIWDVKAAESISSAGDVIIAPAAWKYVNPNEYIYQEMSDRIHNKILAVGPNWRAVQRSGKTEKAQRPSLVDSFNEDDDLSSDESVVADEVNNEEYSLRPSVNFAREKNLGKHLRRFIIAPVMRSIDMQEPFEYLTEMRQSVIVFINIVSWKMTSEETIVVVDEAYKIVCSVVGKVNGCVNKISLFDKDIMLVIVFGLRGLKHELEYQHALRSARQCHLDISRIPGVISVSIGVTSGKTYCGVFGHTLRREYTVISLIVNKAARLMVNYKNKVTCDRETFLHCKMEAANFILQEHKPLKGISHPGPVYEFVEVERKHESQLKITARPILGRDDELKLFLTLLEKYFKDPMDKKNRKMLLIKADARQGKTRLLDEMLFISPDGVAVNKLHLKLSDLRIPYQAIRLLFSVPLHLTKLHKPAEIQQILKNLLGKSINHDVICSLNIVFGVKFQLTAKYKSLKFSKKIDALRSLIRELCGLCITSKWMFAIDNLEFMDAQSWNVFSIFLEIKDVFLVATIGKDRMVVTHRITKLLENPLVHVSTLEPINQWYLGALACHFMNVNAIPAELEKTLQDRSNGSCGWIENFVISMLHDDGLHILTADLRQINDLGLVTPPTYMMRRMDLIETSKWQHLMEEKRLSTSTIREDDWGKFIDCCRDSYLNVNVKEQLEPELTKEPLSVCVLSPNFYLANVESELSIDCMVMKTFDALNSYEQLIIKCGSLLDLQFPRDMLMYVMNANNKKKIALAVKKLFELKVLCCAKGDFLEGENLVFDERLINPSDIVEVSCGCKGIIIDPLCRSLPSYASCGYLQFRSPLIREITYNLLTDNQKKEFHVRAIRYLERETRRCKACGGDFLRDMLGVKHDGDLLIEKSRRRKRAKSVTSEMSMGDDNTSFSRRSSGYSATTASSTSSLNRRRTGIDLRPDGQSILSFTSGISTKGTSRYTFAFNMMRKLKNTHSLTRTFSSEDFTDCRCNLILCATYAQLVHHCSGAGDREKLVSALTEYARILVITQNMPLAIRILDSALSTVDDLLAIQIVNKWKMAMARAKILCLLGNCYLEMVQFDKASSYLTQSLAEYGLEIPSSAILIRLKQLIGLYILPAALMRNRMSQWETMYTNDLSECLSLFSVMYMKQKLWKKAYITAIWGLNTALESFSSFRVTCNAYSNMIKVAQHYGKTMLCWVLEVHALKFVMVKGQVDIDELTSIAKLYSVIFYSRILRANLDKAIHTGYIVIKMCSSVNALRIVLPLMPLLLQCLLILNYTGHVISILQELDYMSESDLDKSAKIWYYALCICFQLETGYTALAYNTSEKFFLIEGDNWVNTENGDAIRRYFTVMWLWCIRNEKWEDASLWWFHKKIFAVYAASDTIINQFTNLYLLEGLILLYVKQNDKYNVYEMDDMKKEIDQLITAIDNSLSINKIVVPRLFHMKGYNYFVRNDEAKAYRFLQKGKRFARRVGNVLESQWIEHSVKAWNEGLSAEIFCFWKEHSEAGNSLDYHELQATGGKFGFFTLPAPTFV